MVDWGGLAMEIEEIAACFSSRAAGYFKSVGGLDLARGPAFGHPAVNSIVTVKESTTV